MQEMSGDQLPQFEGSRVAKQHGDATFMTQLSNPGLQSQKTKPPKTKAKEYGEDDDRAAGPSTLTGGRETEEYDENAVSDKFD